MDNKCLQQVINSKYLGCEISYENGKYVQQTQAKIAQILGIVNNTFKQTVNLMFSIPNVITYKYSSTSLDNTTLYLYTKIVYFVWATCFDVIRSSSGPPRRQIQELYMFKNKQDLFV